MKDISKTNKPFIIAEMSGSHNQSLDRALKIVEETEKASADAIKMQTDTADTMILNIDKDEFKMTDKDSFLYGRDI